MYDRELWKSELHMYQTEATLLGLWVQRAERGTGSDTPEGVF
jgi:hypothetical protein